MEIIIGKFPIKVGCKNETRKQNYRKREAEIERTQKTLGTKGDTEKPQFLETVKHGADNTANV